MTIIKAFRGEFGLKVRYHVPWVYAKGYGHEIEIEEGEEALYPLATRHRSVPRAHDDSRKAGPGALKPLRWFIPQPHIPQPIPEPIDVVICPRKRKYGENKNWPYWERLTRGMTDAGLAFFAAGAPDSSEDVTLASERKAWTYPRFLDATIGAMLQAKVVVATDAGLAHLALLCGRPLIIITYQGRVAPGNCISWTGKDHGPYWPVRMDEYYHAANHQNVPIRDIDAWYDPELVLRTAQEFL